LLKSIKIPKTEKSQLQHQNQLQKIKSPIEYLKKPENKKTKIKKQIKIMRKS